MTGGNVHKMGQGVSSILNFSARIKMLLLMG